MDLQLVTPLVDVDGGGIEMAFLTALALSLIFVTAAEAGEAKDETVVTIPLDQIWAMDMPGTRDVQEYDFGQDDPRIKKRDPRVGGRNTTDLLRSTLRKKPPKQDALPTQKGSNSNRFQGPLIV